MNKKVYRAPGMLDFQLVIRAGAAWVTVHFKGGRADGYGDYSAIFATGDPALQFLIENSPEYRTGRIVRQN